MPLFIMVSGWLFHLTRLASTQKVWSWWGIMKDKLLRLGVPMLVFTAVAMVMKTVFSDDMARESAISFSYYFYGIICPFDGPLNEMWFVGVLLWCFALQPVWKWSLDKDWKMTIVTLALLVLHYIHPATTVLSFGHFCSMGIYFYLGILLSRYKVTDRIEGRGWVALLAGAGVYAAGWCMRICWGWSVSGMVVALGGIVLSCGVALMLDKCCPKVFFSFRDYTYQIFLMGIFFQIVVKMLYRRMDMPYVAGFLLCILIGLYGPVLVSKLLQKINFGPLLVCVGLKKRK